MSFLQYIRFNFVIINITRNRMIILCYYYCKLLTLYFIHTKRIFGDCDIIYIV